MKMSISERVKVSMNPTVTPQHSRKIINLQIWSSQLPNPKECNINSMGLARRQPGFRENYRRYSIRAIRDVNEGPRIVIDGDIRDFTTRVFCRVPINRSSWITRLYNKNQRVRYGEPTRKCEADLREYET